MTRKHHQLIQSRSRLRGLLMTLALTVAGIGLIAASVLTSSARAAAADAEPGAGRPTVTVYKRENCGCCSQWVAHLEQNGYGVDVRSVDSTLPLQLRLGVPDGLRACHTAEVSGYWIEGHVPADLIGRLLDERPADVEGLAVPGMPVGSPGMEGANPHGYSVYAVEAGDRVVYATRDGARTAP